MKQPKSEQVKPSRMRALSRRYEATLRRHLARGGNSPAQALRLGNEAVALGLEMLDVARIHERLLTVITVESSPDRRDLVVRMAQRFFIEVLAPIERSHLASSAIRLNLNAICEALHKRTSELESSNRNIKKTGMERRAAESALKRRNSHHERLLEKSQSLQKGLRQLAHRVLSAQENERKVIRRALQDDIAQALLAINIRLLTLEQKGSKDAETLLKEIANTQYLVSRSARTMRRFASELRIPDEQ